MRSKSWNWALGLAYILAVASIWIAASFVVQSVVDDGVPPFLITYICNSLFLVYIPLVEIGRYLEDNYSRLCFWKNEENGHSQEVGEVERTVLLKRIGSESVPLDERQSPPPNQESLAVNFDGEVDSKGRWTRKRVAKVSLLICPFWFLAQLFFNFSLKYTTVTSNTILSSSSSLFTFLVSLVYLGERFTWVKLSSVLLCMAGTIIVSLGDSKNSSSISAPNPLLGDILSLLSAGLYASYVTLIGKMLPDDDEKSGHASMAQFLGYLGLFNVFLFLPVALVLNITNLEPFNMLTWKQLGLIVGKGFLDNVLSDYLWAKAILLTTTTVATAGLTIQVPLAAIVDTVIGNAPRLLDYLGALAVLIGFAGINIPYDSLNRQTDTIIELEDKNTGKSDEEQVFRVSEGSDSLP